MNEKTENWWSDSLESAAKSDVGMRRANNQDSYCVSHAATPRQWRARGHVFLVADGMGAHAAGELASKLAATTVPQSYLKREDEPISEALRNALYEAHDVIRKRGESEPAFHDMGTTCDALVLSPEGAYVGHVGDSRVYRARGNVIEQLTFDHSLVWEVRYYPTKHTAYRQIGAIPKNIITRSLGPTEHLEVDVEGPLEIRPGDVYLLCSDGLSGRVEDDELGQIMELMSPEEATESLVNLANLRGGPDNITVVVARVKSIPGGEDFERECARCSSPRSSRPSLSGLAWTSAACFCAFLIAGLVCFCSKFEHSALCGTVCVAASLVAAGLTAFLGRKTFFHSVGRSEPQTRRRQGPYARASAAPSEEFADKTRALCDMLCDAVRADEQYEPDWAGIKKARVQAREAREAKKWAIAIRADFSVINYMMREVRKFVQSAQKSKRHKTT